MTAPRRSVLAGISVLAVALSLAACTSAPTPEPSVSQPATEPSPSMVEPAPATPTATPAADASCESILPAETVADFEAIGWTAQENPFYAGAVELTDGLQCTWGDYSVATDHVQIFGWAPASDAESSTAQEELLSSGWTREDSADGIYITESPDTAIATDADGYGITYLFGDGWITIADTKQGLLLIERPQS